MSEPAVLAPRDFNHVILTGTATTAPAMLDLRSGTRACMFLLRNIERYRIRNDTPAERENVIPVEVFGRNVDHALREVRPGGRYIIPGYLRADEIQGVGRIRVRAYNIQVD